MESEKSHVEIIQFGRMGVVEDGSGEFQFVKREHDRDGWNPYHEELVNYLVFRGLNSFFGHFPALSGIDAVANVLSGSFEGNFKRELNDKPRGKQSSDQIENRDARSKKLIENHALAKQLVEESQLIWTRPAANQPQAFYWHPDEIMIAQAGFTMLAFTNSSHMKKWQKRTGWLEVEERLLPRSG